MVRSRRPKHARRGPAGPVLRKAALLFAAVAAAYWYTWAELAQDIEQGSYLGYLYLLPVLAGFAAAGIALRRGAELPIHDRQTDIIVGLIGLGLAAAVLGLLTPRYRYQYELLHLDVLSAWLFLVSGCVLLFGLRPTFRFWPAWLLLFVAVPAPYRLLMVVLGGGKTAAGAVLLILAVLAAAIGSGRTRLRGVAAAGIALVAGADALIVLRLWFPSASMLAYEAIPALAAVVVGCGVMYVTQRRVRTLRPFDRPLSPLTAAQSWSAAAMVVVAGVLLAVIPLPAEYNRAFPVVAGLVTGADAPPPGWELLSVRQYPWAARYLGPDATLTRRVLRAQRGNAEWDKDSRRRRIVVDTVRADSGNTIDNLPEFVLYRLIQPRISPPTTIDLGHGITARLNTVLDDRRLLSWTWLSWNWSGQGRAERISLISADNHLPDAEFPQPQRSVLANFDNLMNQFLRGNAVVLDTESHAVDSDFEVKDREMLTTVALAIVRARTS